MLTMFLIIMEAKTWACLSQLQHLLQICPAWLAGSESGAGWTRRVPAQSESRRVLSRKMVKLFKKSVGAS